MKPVITYGAAIWGLQDYSCINAVQHRAGRFYLGVGRYTPTDAVLGDLGWTPISISQRETVLRHWKRLVTMDNTRLNKKIYKWSDKCSAPGCKNWNYKVRKLFHDNECGDLCSTERILPGTIDKICGNLLAKFKLEWRHRVHNNTGKLRLYGCFKKDYGTEEFVTKRLPGYYRSAYAKFRCGVAPIRLETGRYENLPVERRLCTLCNNQCVEDEKHVILNCPIYDDLRYPLMQEAQLYVVDFNMLTDHEKCSVLFNSDLITVCAKTCFYILRRRRWILYR